MAQTRCLYPGCDTPAARYCESHTCKTDDCEEVCGAGCSACAFHRCIMVGCGLSRRDVVVGGSLTFYCLQHECIEKGCTFRRVPLSSVCLVHACKTPGCGGWGTPDRGLCLRCV